MTDNVKVFCVSLCSMGIMDILGKILSHREVISFCLEATIGFLTILYLIRKNFFNNNHNGKTNNS